MNSQIKFEINDVHARPNQNNNESAFLNSFDIYVMVEPQRVVPKWWQERVMSMN